VPSPDATESTPQTEPELIRDIAKIERTHLGYEDHGILTAGLHMSFGGSGQLVGGYGFDSPPDRDAGETRRKGTAFGCEWIARCLRACGVDAWEKLVGRTVYVLRNEPYGQPVGIEPLPTEKGERFMFRELADEYEEAARA
jgi:hypothetical protein